jgi:F420-dependent oxidoreductase-like protein
MRLSYWVNSGKPWDDTISEAAYAVKAGTDGLWFADHFMPNAPEPVTGITQECFSVLAAFAASFPRVRIGSMVAGNTYRHPAVLAKIAATIDNISGGRLVLGLGAGWQENEHHAYGLRYGTFGERFDRLEEACQIITSLFANERTTFSGTHYQLHDAPLDPKPVGNPLPLLIGGAGEKRTLRIVAQYANEWNCWGSPELHAQKRAVLDQHCHDLGRDPGSVHRSAVTLLRFVDDPDKTAELRARDFGRPMLVGTSEQIVEELHAYQAAGVGEYFFPGFGFPDAARREDAVDKFFTEVAPLLR